MIGDQLQRAIYSKLTTGSIAGGRVYDKPPPSPTFPYVTIGDEQILDDGNGCEDGWEVVADIHVWSRPNDGSKVELKELIAAIVPLLATTLTVTGFRTVSGELETTRSFRDPDGLTEHGVATFRYLIDPA